MTDDTNVLTKDDNYPWLDPDDKQRHMTDAEILRQKTQSGRLIIRQKREGRIPDKDR